MAILEILPVNFAPTSLWTLTNQSQQRDLNMQSVLHQLNPDYKKKKVSQLLRSHEYIRILEIKLIPHTFVANKQRNVQITCKGYFYIVFLKLMLLWCGQLYTRQKMMQPSIKCFCLPLYINKKITKTVWIIYGITKLIHLK